MKKLTTEPLVQFLLLGGVLFFLFSTFPPSQAPLTIVVDDQKLQAYLQRQKKSLDSASIRKSFAAMLPADKVALTQSYIRREVLLREALSLGLDKDDAIIQNRLIQKMEFLALGFYDKIPALTENELETYFTAHIDDYQIAAAVTFTHVFIPSDEKSNSLQRATALLKKLNQQQVPFEQAGQYGERYLYKLNYIDQTQDYIGSHFGSIFADRIFFMEANLRWQGPVQSEYGFHLLLIKRKTTTRSPELSEIAALVLADAQRDQIQTLRAQAISALIDKYKTTD